MKTTLSRPGKIDLDACLETYFRTPGAVTALPREAELKDLARKAIVKDHLILAEMPKDSAAQMGDTVTLRVSSSLARFNHPQVTATLGRGLYDRDLEAAVVGKRIGEAVRAVCRGADVDATVLKICRMQFPEPTDEMVEALHQSDDRGNQIHTVAEYEAYVAEEKTTEALSTVYQSILEQLVKDYPVTDYAPDDIAALGALEKDALRNIVLETEGIDLCALSKAEMQQRWQCDSFDDFIALRSEWYRVKIHQCLILLNLLDLPCEGKTDPLDHYEVLSELTASFLELLKNRMES